MTQVYLFNRNFTINNPPPINVVGIKLGKVKLGKSFWTMLLIIVFTWMIGNINPAAAFPVNNIAIAQMVRPRVLKFEIDDSGIEL